MRWRYPKFGLQALLVMFFLVGLVCLQLRREWLDHNPDFVFEQNLARRIERVGGEAKWNRGRNIWRCFFSVDNSAKVIWIHLPAQGQQLTWNDAERAEILRDIRQLRHVIRFNFTGPEFTDADFKNQPPLPSLLRNIDLHYTNVTWAGLDAATQRNRHLTSLTLFSNSTSPRFTKDCLQRFPVLASVNILSSPLTTNDIRELVSAPSIEALWINQCDFDSTQFALVRDGNLKKLYLSGMKVDGKPISPEVRNDLKARGIRVVWP